MGGGAGWGVESVYVFLEPIGEWMAVKPSVVDDVSCGFFVGVVEGGLDGDRSERLDGDVKGVEWTCGTASCESGGGDSTSSSGMDNWTIVAGSSCSGAPRVAPGSTSSLSISAIGMSSWGF